MAVQTNVKKSETREVISTTTKVDGDKIVTTTRERVTTHGFNYDPSTGTWPTATKTREEESTSSTSNLKSDSTDKDSAQGQNDAKANDAEMNTLSGSLSFIATPDTIQIKAGDTITLKGLGKYLSGDYYVQDVTRNISKDGYSHSATVIRTDFGTSLKSEGGSSAKAKETSTSQSSGIPTSDNGANFKTYTVKQGDTPYLVAKRELNDPSLIGRLFDAKTKERLDVTSQLKVGQEIIIDM